MKKVLLLGSSSFTAFHISELLSRSYAITCCNRSGDNADFVFDAESDDISVLNEHLENVDFVINCVSNGDVDSCESNPDQCKAINFDFVRQLVKLQDNHSFHLIHFSTNAIYDGENAPYSEASKVNPINRYGTIKAQADQFIEDNSSRYTILRPITMYGIKLPGQRHNPFSFFYQQLLENKDIVAVDDVFVNMLNVQDLVKCVDQVMSQEIVGTFNISGDDSVNRYEFVSLIKSFLPESHSQIKKVSSDQFKTVAARPRDTAFDNSKMKDQLRVIPRALKIDLQDLVSLTRENEKRAA